MNRNILGVAIAATASVSFHLAGAHALWLPETADVAGGAEISPAQFGNSFQDIAQGVSEPVATDVQIQDAPPDREPSQDLPKSQPLEAESALNTVQQSSKVAPITSNEAGNPVLPSPTPQLALQSEPTAVPTLLPLATTTPERVSQPTNTIETMQALPNPDENAAAVQVSARPAIRPKSIEQEAVKFAKAKQNRKKPQTANKPRKSAQITKPTKKAATKLKPVQNQGSAQQNQRRGTAKGKRTASKQNQAVGKAKKAQAAGNAAASNFKGLVQRRIARQRQPNIRGKGRVVVSFTIAGNGSLSRIGIAQSSGRTELDKAAMQMVRRAAPFPKPPAGARRNWVQPMTVGR